MCRLFAILAAALALLLAGCNTLDRRIQQHAAFFAALPAAEQERIKSGRLEIGDSPAAAYIALGSPDQRQVRSTGEGQIDHWTYKRFYTRTEGLAVVDYVRRPVYDRHGRLVGVVFTPVYGAIRSLQSEPLVHLEFRDGRLVAIEETRDAG